MGKRTLITARYIFDVIIIPKTMKYIFIFTIGFVASIVVEAQLWSEDFSGEANGATSGTATGTPGGTWSVTTVPSGTFSRQNTFLFGPVLQIDNTVTEGVWESDNFSI